jgi:protease PrsW
MTFPSPLAQPHRQPGPPVPPPPVSPAPLPTLPTKGRRASAWIVAVLVVLLVVLVGYFLSAIGPGASAVGLVLALVPFIVVLLAVRSVDRWEPEPRSLVILAIAWGAIAAVGIALGVDLLMNLMLGPGGTPARDAFGAVIQAPIVEEFAKGLGVFLIFATARRAFDGPVDGVVYGALVGAGFAFTENIQYFAVSFIDGGPAEVSTTFFVRGILSPFAHVMFTSVTGFALGLAARRGVSTAQAVGPWVLGMAGAAALHALWNGSAQFGDFFALYLALQVPLFVGFILGIVALRREEERVTRTRLGEFAASGWFTAGEVDMLSTRRGRRAALAWAKTLPGDRTSVMKGFIADATTLAMARQRALSGRDATAAQDVQTTLARTVAERQALFA